MILSLVMQSYLGDYSGAASNREDKFLRALAGFHGQSRPSDEIELIIVSHGCDKTIEIASDFIKKWSITNIHLHKAERGTLFEGKPRDIGIENANGAYISYLDTDDMILSNHCDKIIKNIAYWKCDWMYYNDYIKEPTKIVQRKCLLRLGMVGTSNICHRKETHEKVKWENCDGYNHDWSYIKKLKSLYPNYCKAFPSGYVVCHVAGKIDF
jgi:glycosyltransferase involved in cell wall biosynthesis